MPIHAHLSSFLLHRLLHSGTQAGPVNQRLRIPGAPLREVCENAQYRSPGVPTPNAECEKRALHLMPD
ncbi:hypothetical protein ATANTOWER_021624 [Ataeniobius toweri]|uniref:Uncharacterized protein n=1 Tax=Ataeniobius toweri TaxID=208326 RepID=A0ABU7CLE5_9TELE|nr:hypothetical protein [Ataeniobius toweri]